MFIDGIAIGGYRSFGSPAERIGPCQKVNLLIGQNNAGKSNVLRFLANHYDEAARSAKDGSKRLSLVDIDRSRRAQVEGIKLSFGVAIDGELHNKYREALSQPRFITLLDQFFSSDAMSDGTPLAWFRYGNTQLDGPLLPQSQDVANQLTNDMTPENVARLWGATHPGRSGGQFNDWVGELLAHYSPIARVDPPSIVLIPTFRKVTKTEAADYNYSGLNLIKRLMELQSPSLGDEDQRIDFDRIIDFVRRVVGKREASLRIPHDLSTILVEMDQKILPLESLGTGVHQVVIIAAASTVLHDHVICIEEPEIHLHPTLQKKLLRYLVDRTDNQYFISTHSASLLDTQDASIFHVTIEDGWSHIEEAVTPHQRSTVCFDLGYRASDLIQANCIIWVEGPSDRILINHWIRAASPDLVEGLEYSIMFYGGRLLSHLTANDPEVDDFISLRRLNRNVVVIMDSDRKGRGLPMSPTKRRVRDEANTGPGFAWETKGREIENYVPVDVLREALREVHGESKRLFRTGQYDKLLPPMADKVKVANAVSDRPADFNVLDLQRQIRRLTTFIENCNAFE